jgi:hypothetical protein
MYIKISHCIKPIGIVLRRGREMGRLMEGGSNQGTL